MRIDGRDVDPGAAERRTFGLSCRLYRTESGFAGDAAMKRLPDPFHTIPKGQSV